MRGFGGSRALAPAGRARTLILGNTERCHRTMSDGHPVGSPGHRVDPVRAVPNSGGVGLIVVAAVTSAESDNQVTDDEDVEEQGEDFERGGFVHELVDFGDE